MKPGSDFPKKYRVCILSPPPFYEIINDAIQTSAGTVVWEASFLHDREEVDLVILNTEAEAPLDVLEFARVRRVPCFVLADSVREGFAFLAKGASEMLVKPSSHTAMDMVDFQRKLLLKIAMIRSGSGKDARVWKLDVPVAYDKIIAIGSSTGGTEAVFKILRKLPANSPPVLVVQHLPPVFTQMFAKRIHDYCEISSWEARDGEELRQGLALIAPGDRQLRMVKKNKKLFVELGEREKISGHCPSVNVLFESVAETAGKNAIGVILTGMGADGASGLLKMRNAGAFTIGQTEESCVVYGMPRAAYETGAVCQQETLEKIADLILKHCREIYHSGR